MKAFYIDEVRKASVKEIEIPSPKDDEVLIKVMAVGLCGTDAHLFLGDYDNPYPTIPGHEFSGVIAGIGRDVKNLEVGQRVAADPNIYCEDCIMCKQNKQNYCLNYKGLGNHVPGAFQQYMVINHRSVHDIGDLSYTVASMAEPLACVLHGHDRARPNFGDRVLIMGAGPIGLMHLQVCKNDGAKFVAIADIKEDQLRLAKVLGADDTVYNGEGAEEEFRRISEDGFDLIIDCTGSPKVIEDSIPLMANEGRMLFFGVCAETAQIQVRPFEIYQRELQFIGSNSLKKTFHQAIQQLQHNRVQVSRLIGDRVLLDDLPGQIEAFAEKKTNLKTIVYPNGFVD